MKKLERSIKKGYLQYLLYVVLASLTFFALLPRVDASLTTGVRDEQIDRQQDLAKIKSALERKEIANHLQSLGMSPDDIEKRLSLLSDEDIHKLATNLETIQPGGDALSTILVLLVLAGLVILILWLAGVIDFDEVKKEKKKPKI